jgi:DNA/RNA endonuclease YhcR with UshA esterase domain
MRTVLALTVFFFISLVLRVGAQDLPTVKDSEAAQYVGKNVEVRGLVVAVYTSKKGNTFLNLGGKYPNQTFTGYIPAGSELAGDRWTVTLQGNVIGITGTVELYQGKPEIKVMSRSQIKGEDSQPVAQ